MDIKAFVCSNEVTLCVLTFFSMINVTKISHVYVFILEKKFDETIVIFLLLLQCISLWSHINLQRSRKV